MIAGDFCFDHQFRSMPRCSAISVAVGARPNCWDSSARALTSCLLKVFEAAGHVDRPSIVAEMSAYLAHHGRHGERQEFSAAVDIEAVDRVDQTDSCSLDEIVMWFASVAESTCDVIGQRQAIARRSLRADGGRRLRLRQAT